MSTLELQQAVLRDVTALLGDTEAMELLHEVLLQLKEAKGIGRDEPESETADIPYPIPGMPYTHEERMQAIREAEADIAAGRVIEWSKFEEEMMKW